MTRLVCLLAVAAAAVSGFAADTGCKPNAPCYSAETVVSAASGERGALAPNVLASIYGTGLSFVERAIQAADILGEQLPDRLAGVQLTVAGWGRYAPLYYVSPTQVNFLIPSDLRPGDVTLQLIREGSAGPAVRVTLRQAAPALFQLDEVTVVASHMDYSLVGERAPARPDEWVILWATGLGEVMPRADPLFIPQSAAPLEQMRSFRVFLDNVPVAADRIGYAGLAPGWGGLYQVNLRVPGGFGPNPEIRLAAGEEASRPGVHIWLDPQAK
jgi:uncharacterized protein (TIGR03437 family)